MSSLEAVFSESAAGTLAYAMAASGKDHTLASAIGVICSPEEEPLSPVEQEALLHREKARQQALWKKAIPLAGDRQNICPLSLVLTLGEIDEEEIGPKRQKVLSRLMDIFPQGKEAAEALTLQNQKSLCALEEGAKSGQPIRVWVSQNPEELCTFHWLMGRLEPFSPQVDVVWLPPLLPGEEQPFIPTGWGEVPPWLWGALSQKTEALDPWQVAAFSRKWKALKIENAPLRGVIAGQIFSLPEDFYDSFLRQELLKLPEQFPEAVLIGRLLGQYPIGMGDAFWALRLEEWIAQGRLEPLTAPEEGSPLYHRMLIKKNRAADGSALRLSKNLYNEKGRPPYPYQSAKSRDLCVAFCTSQGRGAPLVRWPDGHTFFAFLRTTGPARERSMGAAARRQRGSAVWERRHSASPLQKLEKVA